MNMVFIWRFFGLSFAMYRILLHRSTYMVFDSTPPQIMPFLAVGVGTVGTHEILQTCPETSPHSLSEMAAPPV